MADPSSLDRTVDEAPSGAHPSGGSAAERRVEAGPAVAGSASVLSSLRTALPGVPRVQLRDPERSGDAPGASSEPQPTLHGSTSRYLLAGEIARGGMGAILKGRDVDLGRDIAVKVLLETHSGKPDLLQRFVEEAQIGGQLQHPGVVPVYELGQFPDQRLYFTMKLVKGQTLGKLLAERSSPQQERPRFLKVFEQVCQTLAYAHARGVIHRDLKPSNIMVGAFGEVQVMDWGLAKVLAQGTAEKQQRQGQPQASVIRTVRTAGSDVSASAGSHTHAGSVLGTPAYMAPEQALGEIDRLDERCDVFGLGAILCEVLTGQPPYVASDNTQAYRKATRADLGEAFARLDACGADDELIQLAKRCLAPEPDDRPRNAEALSAQLTAHVESVEQRLRQAELAAAEARTKAIEEAKRRKVTRALAASVMLTILGAAGAWWWLANARAARATATEQKVSAALDEAARLREQALRRNYAGAHFIVGVALIELGRYEEAEASFREAIRLRPDHANAYHSLGNALVRQKKRKEAAAAYRKASELWPDLPHPYFGLGTQLHVKGQLDEAIALYKKADHH
jgi:tetratricopeptide (TPR) repeat protein